MKLINVLIVTVVFSFWACKQDEKAKSNTSENHASHSTYYTNQPKTLSINNGATWQTDESTRLHVATLMSETEVFNKNTKPDLAAYQAFSGDIQNELHSLIKDCKMTGPDHKALHHWLEPVLQNVNLLSKAKTRDEAKPLARQLTENILKYNQYFN